MKKMKERFVKLLRSTERRGIEEVINYLEESGFFTAPASTNHHLNCECGLMKHSLNVYDMAMALRETIVARKPEVAEKNPEKSIIIAALLHDTCKANIYKKTQRWKKDNQGNWELNDTYETDYSRLPVGHGEKSVIMLLRLGLELTIDEMVAIRCTWEHGIWLSRATKRRAISTWREDVVLSCHSSRRQTTYQAISLNFNKKVFYPWQ